jgi:hypothetical protein
VWSPEDLATRTPALILMTDPSQATLSAAQCRSAKHPAGLLGLREPGREAGAMRSRMRPSARRCAASVGRYRLRHGPGLVGGIYIRRLERAVAPRESSDFQAGAYFAPCIPKQHRKWALPPARLVRVWVAAWDERLTRAPTWFWEIVEQRLDGGSAAAARRCSPRLSSLARRGAWALADGSS